MGKIIKYGLFLMKNLKKIIATRIKEARAQLKLSQDELARTASLPHLQTVSEIENGKREVKAWELSKIADALHVNMLELMSDQPIKRKSKIFWREEPENKEIIEAEFSDKCEIYARLEKFVQLKKAKSLTQHDFDITASYSDIQSIAHEVKRQLDLGRKPATSLTKVLEEDFGVKIWYKDLEFGSAASINSEEFGPAILMNKNEAPWRRNYNFAHELFHLVTWDSSKDLMNELDAKEELEKKANAFASYLLLPEEEIRLAWKNLADFEDLIQLYQRLIEVAREFDVSTKALLWRLCNLSVIDRETVEKIKSDRLFKILDKATMAAKWLEPPALPQRFVRFAYLAYLNEDISRLQLAKYLNVSLLDLPKILLEYGFNEQEVSDLEAITS